MLHQHNETPAPSLLAFREKASQWTSPVIVFNKSHSGSRMLAELLAAAGLFLGAHINESWDSLDVLELVERVVTDYYPDYSSLWKEPGNIALLLERVFARHLEGFDREKGLAWGWKLCETTYILPLLDFCFPQARYIHLIRDGRDVAFCDHRAADNAFWRKVFFNTDRIRTYHGLRLTPQAYRRHSHLFNALAWVNSVTTGRNYGMMLRERYLEVRYEDLCLDFEATARRVLAFVGCTHAEAALQAMRGQVYTTSVGKHRSCSGRENKQVMAIIKPLLLSLGYLREDVEPPRQWLWRSRHVDNLLDRMRGKKHRY